ncbi:ricin-type beta-trefoil lectin domain protein [Streptomyces sp. NPDC051677]|uniref:ricin-type beta-trefoil lectin domain protein n=1 Tax=Streptomyces sp. NPDC051677 TaxID=3365669 RepID=UPI0037D59E72
MGEPTRKEPKAPGIPGFAASFAASSRQPGDRDTPGVLSRVLTSGLVIVVLGTGVFGIGKLIDYQRDRDRDRVAERAATADRPLSSPSATPTGGREQQSAPPPSGSGRDGGPARYAPPAYNPPRGATSPSASATAGSGGKGASASTPGAGGQGTQQPLSGGGKPVSGGGDSGGATYRIVGTDSNKCIDVTDHIYSAPDKTALQIYGCGNNPNQKWTFHQDGTVRSLGMCMSVLEGSTADGAAIDVYRCNGSASQKWRFTTAGDLVNVKADKCVDVKDFGTADGARLQLYSCAGTGNQKWRLA